MIVDLETQAHWELSGYHAGIESFDEKTERSLKAGRGGDTAAGKKIIPLLITETAQAVSEQLATTQKGGTKSLWRDYAEMMSTEELAAMALHTALSCVGARYTHQRVLKALGGAVRDVALAGLLRDAEDGDVILSRIAKRGNSSRTRRRKAMALAEKLEVKLEEWTDVDLVKAGEVLLNALLATSYFETYTESQSKQTQSIYLGLSDEGRELYQDAHEIAALARPRYLPTLVTPTPWTERKGGAYLTEELKSSSVLVRSYNADQNSLIDHAIKDGRMDRLLNVINKVQDVSLTFDPEMIEAIEWAAQSGKVIQSFPVQPPVARPEMPEGFAEMDPAAKGKFIQQRRRVDAVNRSGEATALLFHTHLLTIKELAEYPEFYQPHNLDYRGRIYPMSMINHQGADWLKACFHFTTGKRIGKQGVHWLAIHAANSGDFGKVSKKPMHTRVEWTEDHSEQLCDVAKNWQTNLWWLEADKPFAFLAACFEWNRMVEGGGEDYVTHLPVYVDGSNSGVQHLSAAARAKEGELVNLSDCPEPQDVYQAVADVVIKQLEDIADWSCELPSTEELFANKGEDQYKELLKKWMARAWLKEGVSRKTVKRNTMTFGYSSETAGMAEQLMEDVVQPIEMQHLAGHRPDFPFGLDNGRSCAFFLAKLNFDTISALLPKVREGMKFFQSCASALAHERKGVTWETPLGLPVVHCSRDWDVKQINLFVLDKTIPVYEADTSRHEYVRDGNVYKRMRASVALKQKQEVNKRAQKSGIAPNVVHSMDATHLLLASERAFSEGVQSLLLIHDSWGSLAPDMPVVVRAIRDTFVELYEDYSPFEAIRSSTVGRLDNLEKGLKKLKPIPEPGSLDLDAVRRSHYAFA
ncbi:DNA-directed RNA polymerase [Pyruvatibacter sp.]